MRPYAPRSLAQHLAVALAVLASACARPETPPADVAPERRGAETPTLRHDELVASADVTQLYLDGVAALQTKRSSKAVTLFGECVDAAPTFGLCHLGLGMAAAKLKRLQAAASAYRRYLELSPDAPDAEHVRALLASYEKRR